jgi:hypothetical protein
MISLRANTGSSGQRLCRSKTASACQKWRENEKSLASPAAAAESFRWVALQEKMWDLKIVSRRDIIAP